MFVTDPKSGKTYDVSDNEDGFLMYTACYNMMSKIYGKPVKFEDLINRQVNYGIMEKYQGQFFYHNLAYLERPEILENPTKNKTNYNRILKIKLPIRKLVKKKSPKKKRPSPSMSATLYNVGTKKRGNDGNIWIITTNKNGVKRWKKI